MHDRALEEYRAEVKRIETVCYDEIKDSLSDIHDFDKTVRREAERREDRTMRRRRAMLKAARERLLATGWRPLGWTEPGLPAKFDTGTNWVVRCRKHDDPKIEALKEKVRLLNQELKRIFSKHGPRLAVRVIGKLGRGNPDAWRYSNRQTIRLEHAGYVDVYVSKKMYNDFESLEALDHTVERVGSFDWVLNAPTYVRLDERYLPHCADGPWIEWSDGTKRYAWHGMGVPSEWIEIKKPNVHPSLFREMDVLASTARDIVGLKRGIDNLLYVPDVDQRVQDIVSNRVTQILPPLPNMISDLILAQGDAHRIDLQTRVQELREGMKRIHEEQEKGGRT